MIHKTTIEPPRLYAEETDPLAEAFLGNFALISCAIKLLLYETGGEAGPCPPPGHLHHYRFRLMALDVAQLDIPSHAKCQVVQRAAEPHKLAEATLVGTYAR